MVRHLLLTLVLTSSVFPALAHDQPDNKMDSWRAVSFKSEPLLNLHLFLYELARDKHFYTTFKKEGEISDNELHLFDAAVRDYIKQGADRNIHIIMSNDEMADLTAMILGGDANGTEPANNALYDHVQAPSTIYDKTLWGHHRESNLEWVQSLRVKLDVYGDSIFDRLESLFGEKLIVKGHTVNVVYKPGMRQGATTSGRNFQTIINSTYPDYADWFALEMFFHEISHANAVRRESKLQKIIAKEFNPLGLDDKKGIWHPIQFYTVGQVVKSEISEDVKNYIPYAEMKGLYVGSWDYKSLLDQYWMPYLDGEVSMEQAIRNIALALSEQDG
ncbi:hypothetical protein [Microbulbifer variabilis]|uniref:hypothetical protein n=1 Tax=Microbulbifer variabilis TaxID=266805 RepID=UPI001CFD0209|nr:hypothetical protein [Microbulbifer variabilis]